MFQGSSCSLYQYFIPSYGWIIFHCMYITICLCSICWWTFGLSPSFNDAINIHMQVFMWIYILFLWGTHLWEELVGHIVVLCSTFWRTPKLFSTVAAPFYIPTSNIQRFLFLHILANTSYFLGIFCFYFLYKKPS